jgi:hypothetical protein
MEHSPFSPDHLLRLQLMQAQLHLLDLEDELGQVQAVIAALKLLLGEAAEEGPE